MLHQATNHTLPSTIASLVVVLSCFYAWGQAASDQTFDRFFKAKIGPWVDAGDFGEMFALVRSKEQWQVYFNSSYGILCYPCYTFPDTRIDSFPDPRRIQDSLFSQWARAHFDYGIPSTNHAFIRVGKHHLMHRLYSHTANQEWLIEVDTLNLNLGDDQSILALGPIEAAPANSGFQLKMNVYGTGGHLATLSIKQDSIAITYINTLAKNIEISYVAPSFWGDTQGRVFRKGDADSALFQLDGPIRFINAQNTVVQSQSGQIAFSYAGMWRKTSKRYPAMIQAPLLK